MSGGDEVVRAAGGVVWRGGPAGPEIVLVHRLRYGDWSLPKGKLDPGESWLEAAVREVREETGLVVEVGEQLGEIEYPARENGDRPPRRKVVRYWMMRAIEGGFTPSAEVDAVRWLPLPDAVGALTYEHDRALLRRYLSRRPPGDPTGTR